VTFIECKWKIYRESYDIGNATREKEGRNDNNHDNKQKTIASRFSYITQRCVNIYVQSERTYLVDFK